MKAYSGYKDSGVEWLGEIPEHWECIRMKHLFKDHSEKNKPNEELLSVTQNQGVVPRSWVENRMVMPSGALESFKFIKKGDFAISLRSFEGGLEYCYHDGIISPAYTVLKTKRKIADNYYKYLFKSFSFISEIQTSIVGIREGKNISYPELSYSFLPVPVLEEQTAIANFLDDKTAKIDQAIAIKEQQIALLKERKQIIIQEAVTKGLEKTVKMKDSGVEWIGTIPEHWEVKRLKYILKSQGRIGFKGYTTSDLVDEGHGALALGATHMNWDGSIILDEPVFISWKKYYESPEIMVRKDNILIVQRGSTCGKVALVDKDFGPTTINPSLVLLKEIRENSDFVFLGIKVVLSGILNIVSNTAIPMLSQFQINNIQIAIPAINEQIMIVNYVKKQSTKIDQAVSIKEQEIEKLKEYKVSLIDAVVTGKVKVC
jgi:type I restriction enzyme S subunit